MITRYSHRSKLLTAFFATLLLVLISAPAALEQQPSPANPQAPQSPAATKPSGMSTGGAHTPVKDAKSLPITAGGFVDAAPTIFLDITHLAGLDKLHRRSGSWSSRSLRPGFGSLFKAKQEFSLRLSKSATLQPFNLCTLTSNLSFCPFPA